MQNKMEPLLLIPVILSFFITFLFLPSWIRKAKQIGLIWEDMNKHEDKKKIAGSGGVVVIMAFIFGILSYIAIKTFVLNTNITTIEIFAMLTTVLIASFIGLVDDFFGWVKGGLSVRLRILLVLIAAVPLMVINAGGAHVVIPFLGKINLGLIYPMIVIPIGIAGASTTFNFLAGYNGLEAGQGILLIGALSLVSLLKGYSWLALIGFCMIATLAAFLVFNRFPARVFPGNVLTYGVGALAACITILGNFEKIAIFFFIPYIAEIVLKSRGRLKKQSFGKPQKDNSLELPYKKIYGLEHFAIWFLKKVKRDGKVYEKDVVYFIHILQVIVIIAGFIIFRRRFF